ncbi:MAG: ribbon-helix-helix domain-containing protein [Desulfovibrionales bacterium]
MKRINLYLPEALVQDLHGLALERGTTFSSLTRQVLQDFVDHIGGDSREDAPGIQEKLHTIEEMVLKHGNELSDVKAVLELVLHYAKRSASP